MTEAKEKARQIFKKHGGTLRTKEAISAGIHPRTLYALRDVGELEQLARGLYRLTEMPPLENPDLATVAKRVPQGVICLISALAYHELTTQVPHAVHVALPRTSRYPALEYPPLQVYRFSRASFEAGIETKVIDDIPVRMYSAEKTLADCFKYRNKIGFDVAIEALRTYRRRRRVHLQRVLEFARICRVRQGNATLPRGRIMIKRPLKNVAASVHQRLLNISKQRKRPFNELLQYYALERWLYRMSRSEFRERLVLKGALMLLVWDIPVTRPTRDIDLLGRLSNDLESVRSVIADVCRVPVVDDGMNYDPASVITERISAEAEYEGVRAKFQGHLGRARVPMQIDIGFSDIITPGPVEITYPSILGMPLAQIGAYNRETVIAEKFESMVKRAELNSRIRDFFDVWALATNSDFQRQDTS